MPDRKKVIKGLECCKNKTMLWQHDQCPYHGFDEDCESNLHADALALLKEQAKTKVVFGRTKDGEFVTECGNCGTYLDKAYSNCPKCKKELDWNSNQT